MMTKTALRIAALLLAAAPAWSAGPVTVENGLLTMKARNMPLREILQQIASQAKVEIVVQGGTEQAVSADFTRTALEEALRRLTQDFNSVFLYGPKQMKKVLLYAKNAPSGGKAEVQQEIFAPGGAVAAASPSLPDRAPVRSTEAAPPSPAEENDAEAEQESLAELIKSDDPALREEAVGMLVELEDGSGLSQLAEMLLRDEDSGIRQLIAEALGSAGDRKAVPALGKALEDKDAEVRSMAVYSLGQLGGEEAMALIKKAQRDKKQAVREAAADALEMAAEAE
ncbi:MAG: HEAT repeat domain-containing protein [Candidatus Electronema sp. VV]